MRYVGADQVHQLCDWLALVDALAEAHRGPRPLVARSELLNEGPAGERQIYLNFLAWQPGKAMGTKCITVMPGNSRVPDGPPAGQALYTLFSGQDGSPIAVIDGTALSYRKTAADSALGSKLLSRPDARTLLMVGAGALAPYLIEAHRAVRPSLERILVWNRTGEKARALAEALSATAVSDLENAARLADIVCSATASTAPIVRGSWLRPGAHLDLVGGFTHEMRECDDEAVLCSRLFVDSWMFGVDQPGDLGDPIQRGVIAKEKIEGDLFDLCLRSREFVRRRDDITLFKNGGGGHLDLFTALFLAERLAAER